MPAPAVYILAVVGTIGAVIAFKEFVYEPHIAPAVERWAEEFIAKREAKRRQRAGEPIAVAVPLRRRNRRRSNDSNSSSDESVDHKSGKSKKRQGDLDLADSVELENLVAREVREWRSEVDRSTGRGAQLRQRLRRRDGGDHPMNEVIGSNGGIPYSPLSPTHVIFDPSVPMTPSSATASTVPSRLPSPPAQVSPLDQRASVASSTTGASTRAPSTIQLQPPTPVTAKQQTTHVSSPALSHGETQHSYPVSESDPSQAIPLAAPFSIPSLSQSYPQELDAEHGIVLLSPPSSRAESPFSSISNVPENINPFSSPNPARHSPDLMVMNDVNGSFDALSPARAPEHLKRETGIMGRSSPGHGSSMSSLPELTAPPGLYLSALSSPSPVTFRNPLEGFSAPSSPAPPSATSIHSSMHSAGAREGAQTPQSASPRSPASFVSSPFFSLNSPPQSLTLSPRTSETRGSASQRPQTRSPHSQARSPTLGSPYSQPHSPHSLTFSSPRSPQSVSGETGSTISDLDFLSDLDAASDAGRSDASWAI